MIFSLHRNIQYHGGPVTFVSVNKATGSVHDLSEVGIGGDRVPFVQSEDFSQGSHTLPRALSAKKSKTPSGNPPDHVIITSRPADGGNSVRIQIGGAQHQNEMRGAKSKAAPPLNDPSPKRKYSLKEVEVEGLLSSSEGEDVMTVPRNRGDSDQDEDMFDLNSLIEGAVDDDEEDEGPRGPTPSQMYFRPVRDASSGGSLTPKSKAASSGSAGRLQRVEDDQVSSEDDDLLSMAPNQGSMTTTLAANLNPAPIPSDTDGDFLDRKSTASSVSTVTSSAKSVVLAKPRVSVAKPMATSTPNNAANSKRLLPEKPKLQLSSPLLAPKLKELQQQLEVPKSGNPAPDSDLDSISTTSASYVVNHSDLDSFVIEEQQQQNKEQHEMQHQQVRRRQFA